MTSPFSRWHLPVFLASWIFGAACVATSWINTGHNADTILQTLISIDGPAPYYWGENRFGMLVPLLASPIRNYGWNLMFQVFLVALTGIGSVWLVSRLIAGDRSSDEAMAATPLVLAGLLLLLKSLAALVLLLGSTYLPPLFLLLAAVSVTIDPRIRWWWLRVPLVALLLALSLWINLANSVFAGVLLLLWPPGDNYDLRRRIAAIATLVTVFAGMQAFAKQFPGPDVQAWLPPSEWVDSLRRVLADASLRSVHARALMALLLAAMAFSAMKARRLVWNPGLALATAAAAQIAVAPASGWVAKNGYDSRYILSPLLILGALSLSTILIPVASSLIQTFGRDLAVVMASLMLAAMCISAFGVPSPARGLGFIENSARPAAAVFERTGCTHLIGDYWRVWPAIFHDRLVGRQPARWPVTFRSDAERSLQSGLPQAERTYCSDCEDKSVEYIRILLRIPPLRAAGQDKGVCLFRAPSP